MSFQFLVHGQSVGLTPTVHSLNESVFSSKTTDVVNPQLFPVCKRHSPGKTKNPFPEFGKGCEQK